MAGQRSLVLLPLIVLAAAIATANLTFGPIGHPTVVLAAVLLTGTVLFEGVVSRFTLAQQRWTLSVTESVLVVVLAFEPGVWVGPVGGLGLFAAQLVRRRRDPFKVSFNVLQYTASFSLGGLVANSMPDPRVGAVIGGVVFWALNLTLVSAGMMLLTGDRMTQIVRDTLPLSSFHIAVNVSTGLAMAVLIREDPAATVGLVFLVLAVLVSYTILTRRVEETALMDVMLAERSSMNPLTREGTAHVILRTVSRVYNTSDVRMVLLRRSDGPMALTLDAAGQLEVATGALAGLDEGWILRSLAEDRGVLTGTVDSRAWCAVRIGSAGQPAAALLVARGGTAPGFDRGDVRVAKEIAKRAQKWLDLSSRSHDGQAPSDAAEAVQSAAFALAQKAARIDEAGDIALMSALHDVQRAVTALLGTGPQPAACPQAQSPVVVQPNWGRKLRSRDWITLPVGDHCPPAPSGLTVRSSARPSGVRPGAAAATRAVSVPPSSLGHGSGLTVTGDFAHVG